MSFFLCQPEPSLSRDRPVLKTSPALHDLQQQPSRGRQVPAADDLWQFIPLVWGDYPLTDVVANPGFYQGFFISERLKMLLERYALPVGDVFFASRPLLHRGELQPYWWFQMLPFSDENVCIDFEQSVFYGTTYDKNYKTVQVGPMTAPDLNTLLQSITRLDNGDKSAVWLTQNAADHDFFYLSLLGLNGLVVSERLHEALHAEGISGLSAELASWLHSSEVRKTSLAAPAPEAFHLSPDSGEQQIPGIPPNGLEPPYEFTQYGYEQWFRQFSAMISPPRKHKKAFLRIIQQHIRPSLTTLGRQPDESAANWETASRIGGKPMLPPGFSWPVTTEKERPLAFIAQVNLAETAGLPGLPSFGLLSFFVDLYDSTEGWPQENDRFQVCFFEDLSGLTKTDFPENLPVNADLDMLWLGFVPFYDFPDDRWAELHSASAAETEALEWFREEHQSIAQNRLKLMGHPASVQGQVALEAVLWRDYASDWQVYEKRKSTIDAQARDMVLLMEGYAPYLGLQDFFGDAEMYFLIPSERLAARDFSAVQLVMQNT